MGYEREVMLRAKTRYQAAIQEHLNRQQQTRLAVYAKCPEIQALDEQLQQTMAEVMSHAFRHGEDPREAMAQIREKNLTLQRRRNHLLDDLGYAPEALEERRFCPKCRDTGYLGEKMCDCLSRYCIEEQKKELTSLLHGEQTFDDFKLEFYPETVDPVLRVSPRQMMETVYETCLDYARHFSPARSKNLLFCGGTGLGKTFLSACIAHEVVSGGHSVVYDSAINIFACLESQKFGSPTPEELRQAERISKCDLLILDDLGTEMKTSFIDAALYQIVNSRIMNKKPMIISSNSNIDQLSQRYTPQIESRLRGEFQILNFMGQDIRRLKNR